jgi:transposase InsO family protein/transposase
MSVQLALRFDEVPITCETQQRYHSISPCLAGKRSAEEQADALGLSYSAICRWLRQFRDAGMPGLFPATDYPREPQTPERVIVLLVIYKGQAPGASDRELARVVYAITDHRIHHETVKALLARYPLWRYPDFKRLVQYQAPSDPQKLREEMVKLRRQGWTEKRIAQLLRINRNTVMKWLRRARQAELQPDDRQPWLLDLSRAPHRTSRKVFFGAIHAVLTLQKKYGYAGAFRIKGYLEQDYGIYLSETTIRKIMALNRRLHLAPRRPIKVEEPREIREGPKKSRCPFEHVFVDFRYLDAKPGGVQLYSCTLLEGFSRTILAGSLTTDQDAGVLLHVYFQGLLRWGLWAEIISDHGGQFNDRDWVRVNKRLGILHEMYLKGHPWQNLIESYFGIEARLGEYHWERCKTIEAAQEFHRELIRDYNRLPHWAHRLRNDGKDSPLAVLGAARGKQVESTDLDRAFGQRYCQRMTDARGFVRVGQWRIYVEEGLPRAPVQLSYWNGKLRAEHQSQLLVEYQCKWVEKSARPTTISQPLHHAHPFQSRQMALFDPLWIRHPADLATQSFQRAGKKQPTAEQLRLYLGPELVKTA